MSKVLGVLTGCLVLITITVASVDISKIFKICSESGPVNECLKESMQDAFRKVADGQEEINFPPLDPLKVGSTVIPIGSGAVYIEQNYTDINIFNICRLSEIKDVESSIDSSGVEFLVQIFSPEYTVKANYELNGRVLFLPIAESGPCVFQLDDVKTSIQMTGNILLKEGKIYGNIQKVLVNFAPKKASFRFENLYNGDKFLGDLVNRFLNDNWEALFEAVKDNYQNLVADKNALP